MHGVVVADTDGRVVTWDAGAETMLGQRERHWAGFRRAMPTGAMSIDADAAGDEEPWGSIRPKRLT